jgi:hypothetical protein
LCDEYCRKRSDLDFCSKKKGLSTGVIVGLVIGIIALMVLGVLFVCCVSGACKWSKRDKSESPSSFVVYAVPGQTVRNRPVPSPPTPPSRRDHVGAVNPKSSIVLKDRNWFTLMFCEGDDQLSALFNH